MDNKYPPFMKLLSITHHNMKLLTRNSPGFSLVELLLYMGLSTILLVVLTALLVTNISVQLESQALTMVEQDGRYLYQRLAYDLYQASEIVTPANLGDTNNQLVLNVDGTNYLYQIINNQLYLSYDGNNYLLTSPDIQITQFEVTRIGNPDGKHAIDVNFEIESLIETTPENKSRQYQTTLGLR